MGKTNSRSWRKAQVSAEVIIVTAAVLAVAFILVTQLQKTAQDGAKTLSSNAKKVFTEINDTLGVVKEPAKKATGDVCSSDDECKSGNCGSWDNTCQ